MVPHSLNEQKCIGELVRAGWVLMRVEVKTSARTRCTHIALSVPLQGSAALHSDPQNRADPQFSRLRSTVDQVSASTTAHKGPVRGSCPCYCDACHSSSQKKKKKHHSMSIWQKRTCKPHPSYLRKKKKSNKKKKKKKKQNCTHRYPCGL